MSEVINIGDFAFKHNRWPTAESGICKHQHMTMCEDGHVVTCDDCKIQLSAYWVLSKMLDKYKSSRDSLERELAAFQEEKSKSVVLLAARRVEHAWRRREMLPTCPHCHRGISAYDGFGGSMINKKIENKRRESDPPKRWR